MMKDKKIDKRELIESISIANYFFYFLLKLNKVDNPSHSIEIPMKWMGYEDGCEKYFVELLGDSRYTYEWEDISDTEEGFESGAWKFNILEKCLIF